MTTTPNGTILVPLATWRFRPVGQAGFAPVQLPHDAMLAEQRGPDAAGGADTGWFPGGTYEYRTSWRPAEAHRGRSVSLRFEGIQGDATVSVNGIVVGVVSSGYTESELAISERVVWDADNEIVVHVDNSAQPGSRWYPGSGLYRPVNVVLRADVHFATDGVRFRTRSVDPAVVEADVEYRVAGAGRRLAVTAQLWDGDRLAAEGAARGGGGSIPLAILNPAPWSAEQPHLYELVVRVLDGEDVLDTHRERVGLRTIELDAAHGLRINGDAVLLRGACVHSDNGCWVPRRSTGPTSAGSSCCRRPGSTRCAARTTR